MSMSAPVKSLKSSAEICAAPAQGHPQGHPQGIGAKSWKYRTLNMLKTRSLGASGGNLAGDSINLPHKKVSWRKHVQIEIKLSVDVKCICSKSSSHLKSGGASTSTSSSHQQEPPLTGVSQFFTKDGTTTKLWKLRCRCALIHQIVNHVSG